MPTFTSQTVSSGQTSSGVQLGTYDVLVVLSGGTAIDTTAIQGGGGLAISAGGIAISSLIGSAGDDILYGGSASATTISSGGYELVSSGGVSTGAIVLSGGDQEVYSGTTIGATVEDDGTIGVGSRSMASGTMVASGGLLQTQGATFDTVISNGGTEFIFSQGVTSGTVVQSGGQEYVYSAGVADATQVLSGGTEFIYSASVTSGTVVADGGIIDVTDLAYDPTGSVTIDQNDLLTVVESGTTYTQQLGGNYTGAYFHLSNDGTVGTDITVNGTPCYCRGTLILTEIGEVAVERLAVGDRLVTHSGTVRPVRWIGTRRYGGVFAARNPDILPVLIRQGALGDDVPRRDLLVSPLHAMFLDEVLVPAACLVNGVSILRLEAVDEVEYFHVELDSHDVIIAEGAASESFVDDGSRGMFHNAAEFDRLYPDAPREPARYCAQRIEQGEALDRVRRRLAARAMPAEAVPNRVAPLLGAIDELRPDRIRGWASEAGGGGAPVRLRVLDNDVVILELDADLYRADLELAGVGSGRHGFDAAIPGGLSPTMRHVIRVCRAADGIDLPGSCRVIEAVPLVRTGPPRPNGALHGHLDQASRTRFRGWAQDRDNPDDPVSVLVLDNGQPIARAVANLCRDDLATAGLGRGQHGFDVTVPAGLSPATRHVIQVLHERSGVELVGSPVVIEAADSFDDAFAARLRDVVASTHDAAQQEQALRCLLDQTERLLQSRAELQGAQDAREAHRLFTRRWGPDAGTAPDPVPDPGLRALVVDDRLPDAARDAGSRAMLSHVGALTQLGYQVSLVGSEVAAMPARLIGPDVTCLAAPFYAGVEDVLRRHRNGFDLVYLHRADIAARYGALVRHYLPRARLVYSVADLHHVRLERQAVVEERPELRVAARRMRLAECTAAWGADVVITHSADEAALLRQAVPEARIHRVPWHVPLQQAVAPFAQRSGVAFIGSYRHAPNLDAAHWLVETIMPLVWRHDPGIECLLVGSDMPNSVRRLASSGRVVALGHAPDLWGSVLNRVRLTVAPLRFGAGIKGKVLDSLAAGLPCVMSPVAAEGLTLSPPLQALVGRDAEQLATLIRRLHTNAPCNRQAARAGTALIRRDHGEDGVRQALQAAIETRTSAGPSRRSARRRLQAG